jgi:lipoyl-dependent peroxiredoxin
MQRRATAVWRGALKNGKGVLSTQSSILSDTPFSFKTRFENGIATNPEELLAAAHAGCFAMALSPQLGRAGLMPENLEITATVTFENVGENFAITKSPLDLRALVPGANQERRCRQGRGNRLPRFQILQS